jgi:hypothetical protein
MKLEKQSIYHKEIRNTKRDKRDEDSFAVLDGGWGGGWSQIPRWIKRVFLSSKWQDQLIFLSLNFSTIFFLFLEEP